MPIGDKMKNTGPGRGKDPGGSVQDGKNSGKIKKSILRYLNGGKNNLLPRDRQIAIRKNFDRLLDETGLSGRNHRKIKRNFNGIEKRAEQYVRRNPQKAVAMGAAVGALAVGFLSSSKVGKKALKKKSRPDRS